MSETVVYLDNNATTRADQRVVAAMLPLFSERYGNPSSAHHFGAQVAVEIEEARRCVAQLIGARDSEIVFTSGGTEADNAALRGVLAARPSKRHIVITAVEHHAILETAEQLEHEGVEVSQVGVDGHGRLDLDALANTIREDTVLISAMLANNETGVIFPLNEVSRIAKQRGVLVHTDAVNAAGKTPINVDQLGVNLLSLSSHKMYGPMGVGALCIRRGTPFRPILIGGPQEQKRRGGTLNAPGIVGFGKACEILAQEGAAESERIATLRERLEAELTRRFKDAVVLGAAAERLPNTSCVCFPGVEAEAVVLLLSEARVYVSSGAACSSGSLGPSHVLDAMAIDPQVAQGQVRFSLGRFNSDADIDRLLEVLPPIVDRVAAVSFR